MRIKSLTAAIALSLSVVTPFASAQSVARASQDLSQASEVGASVAALAVIGTSTLVVTGVRAIGESIEVTFKAIGQGAEGSLVLTREIAEAASIATGTTVRAISETTGHALVASGKMIAFIPNEVGKALLHHDRHSGGRL